ncbi:MULTISPECIES: hypothetical protein [Burkholderia]|uniref:Uncharacterized protein n=1 Tax=Burkholderia paludis TaxID=1506587 RepID=A0A6J5F7S4_9BURK|nr:MULTISPECIES: hypothetical protein [Burkholderia]CAB3773295.1 hypothetical protein LMG30113_07063 [Burkholderia paludis]VWB85729.1 hypothetical protein BPA30113_03962 [Burkholderia paludis]
MSINPTERNAIIRAVFADGASYPDLTPGHVALMRRLRVVWLPVESGAPAIYPESPLTGSDATIDLAKAILDTDDDVRAIRTLAELGHLVPEFVTAAGELAPGHYVIPEALREAFDFPESGVDTSGHFELRAEHLDLLRAALWMTVDSYSIDDVLSEDDFWPLPCIDGKRPYGDCSYIQIDMAELLGEPYQYDAERNLIEDADKDARLERLHYETLAALQVFLMHAELTTPA